MRIIQIIDSLDTGGAERMAVNYANALAKTISFSGLVVTRSEGLLFNTIDKNVQYLFLNKKNTTDYKALFRLRNYVIKNKVTIIHAHSTSFFFAFLLKIVSPKLKIIWHDHYGDSEFLSKRPILALKIAIPFFNGIIAVNQLLKRWSIEKLHFKNTMYLPNFSSFEKSNNNQIVLKGIEGKRIVCLANLRIQKNHFLLLDVAKKLKKSYPKWTFHLVGKDFEDDYSKQLKLQIKDFDLKDNVFIYGEQENINQILNQCSIGILTSKSEGLPVALLEYGLYKKPVVVTNVGEIPHFIENRSDGIIVPSDNADLFYEAIIEIISDTNFSDSLSENLNQKIINYFSETAVIKQYLNWLKKV